MKFSDDILKPSEIAVFRLRELFAQYGYTRFEMSKFEEYELYAANKAFLGSDDIITFTDEGGRLKALRPDVTLSVVKNTKSTAAQGVTRLYYNENVYRRAGLNREFRELAQSGIECIGEIGTAEMSEVLALAAKSLELLTNRGIIAVSHMTGGEAELREVLDGAKKLCPTADFRYDPTVSGDISYYDGIIFQGYAEGIPTAILSGGRYDSLMRKFGRSQGAIGFAVYVDMLERRRGSEEAVAAQRDFINIALPKGRLGEQVYGIFERCGYGCADILSDTRKLVFENAEAGVRYFWVKPSDVAIYVERGAADIGVCGSDILAEHSPEVYELHDLGVGVCRLAVAAPKEFTDTHSGVLRVATKFTETAKRYYDSINREIDIIKLNGSIELAPLLGLSDVIVDLVETGNTLRANGLEVKEWISDISARLIANKSSYKFKQTAIARLAERLSK